MFVDFDLKLNLILDVYTIMNTLWGQPSPACYATIEFFGQNGAYAIYPILGNYNIRDYIGQSRVFWFQSKKNRTNLKKNFDSFKKIKPKTNIFFYY